MCYAAAIAYAARFRGALCDRRDLQLRQLPREHAKLSPRPAPRRIWRRARPAQRAKLLEISPLTRGSAKSARRCTSSRAPTTRACRSRRPTRSSRRSAPTATRSGICSADNEGHGFAKKENLDYQFWTTPDVLAEESARPMSDPPLRAAIIPVTPLQQNCTLLWCTETMRGAFVDPGGDLPRLKAAAAQAGVDDREDPADPRPYRPLRVGRHPRRGARGADRRAARGRHLLDQPAEGGRRPLRNHRPAVHARPLAGRRRPGDASAN